MRASDIEDRAERVRRASVHSRSCRRRLQTENHLSGSDRAKLHAACKAVDFRIEGAATDEVLRYLPGRRGSQASPSMATSSISTPTSDTSSPPP